MWSVSLVAICPSWSLTAPAYTCCPCLIIKEPLFYSPKWSVWLMNYMITFIYKVPHDLASAFLSSLISHHFLKS